MEMLPEFGEAAEGEGGVEGAVVEELSDEFESSVMETFGAGIPTAEASSFIKSLGELLR
jgi:hypothetical protein